MVMIMVMIMVAQYFHLKFLKRGAFFFIFFNHLIIIRCCYYFIFHQMEYSYYFVLDTLL